MLYVDLSGDIPPFKAVIFVFGRDGFPLAEKVAFRITKRVLKVNQAPVFYGSTRSVRPPQVF
jgi:hypothetical protein